MNIKEIKDIKALKKDTRVRIETKGDNEIIGVEIGRNNILYSDEYRRTDGLKIKRRRITKGVQEITNRRANTNERKQRHRDKADPTIIINQVKRYEKAEQIEKNRSREEKQIIAGELGEIDKINRKEAKALKKKIQSLKNDIEEIAIRKRQQELREQIKRLNEIKHKGKDLTDEEKKERRRIGEIMNKKHLDRLMIEELTEKVRTQTITDHTDTIRETIKGISEEVRARRQKKEEEKEWRQRCKEYNMNKHQEKKEEKAKAEAKAERYADFLEMLNDYKEIKQRIEEVKKRQQQSTITVINGRKFIKMNPKKSK